MAKTDEFKIIECGLITDEYCKGRGCGFGCNKDLKRLAANHKAPSREQVEIAEKWIQENCIPTKQVRRKYSSCSYTLKHVCERDAHTYISNGAFIQAAVNCGYQYSGDIPNPYFDIRVKRES